MKARYLFSLIITGFLFATTAWAEDQVSPLNVDGATTINTIKAKALFDEGVAFIDVRKDKDWAAGRIPDAIHIELKKKLNEISLGENVKKDEKLVLYCNGESCMRSSKATTMAVGWGFTKVYYYRDGFPAWKGASYPVE